MWTLRFAWRKSAQIHPYQNCHALHNCSTFIKIFRTNFIQAQSLIFLLRLTVKDINEENVHEAVRRGSGQSLSFEQLLKRFSKKRAMTEEEVRIISQDLAKVIEHLESKSFIVAVIETENGPDSQVYYYYN